MALRFLHAADLHLGLRVTRFDEAACERIGEARFFAIEQLRDKAIEHGVQFVVIAGDLFDDHSVSRRVSERAFELLEGKKLPCPVFIIPGNHDPLTPGGVWDRDPWTREQPTKNIRLLREAVPVSVPEFSATLFPCPLRHRNSIDDPTAWIARHPRADGERTFRIGIAHGSLNVLPNLPLDDHLIRKDAAEVYGLDYLAMGHWHKPFRHRTAIGAERTAYPGTHEPMRFPDSGAAVSTGWSSYSSDGDAERFQDEGRGTASLVTIDSPGAPPTIETIEIGRLRWTAESRDLTGNSLGSLISEFAQRENPERTLLHLTLGGVVDPRAHARIGEVVNIVKNRYHAGSAVLSDAVLIEPESSQLSEIVGDGVLKRVLGRLSEQSKSSDAATRRVADHALKLLYRIAWEESPR